MTVLAALLAAAAVLLALPPRPTHRMLASRGHRARPVPRRPPRGDARPRGPEGTSEGPTSDHVERVVRWSRTRLPAGLVRVAGHESGPSRTDIADLTERLAAFARAGLPAARAWQLLAEARGPGATIAARVAAMAGAGGSIAAGLRLAAGELPEGRAGPADAVYWLALATDVVERSGAPSAGVHDGVAAGLLAELSRAEEQEVALAGARTTAGILAALPLGGIALGLLMGANVPRTLLGTVPGRACLVLGAACWIAGRWWSRRLVTAATGVT